MAAFVRAAVSVATAGGTCNIAETSGSPQAGDMRYIFCATQSPGPLSPIPVGWTPLYNATASAGTLAVFQRAWAPGQGTQFLSFSGSTYDFVVEVVSVAAADTTATAQCTGNSGTGTAMTATGLTPAVAGELQLVFFSNRVTANGTTATFTTPSGFTVADTRHPTTAAGAIGMVASRPLTTTAATGNAASTSSQTGTWRTSTVVIRAAPVVAGATGAGTFLDFFGGGL